MEREKCVKLIKKRIKEHKEEREKHIGFTMNCDDWFDGLNKGLLEALEIVGMLNKTNNR